MKLDKIQLFILMANKEIGQRELADIAGVGETTITAGYKRKIRPKTIGKIAKALNVSVDQIILKED